MGSVNVPSDWLGFYKRVYAEKVVQLIPESMILRNRVKFTSQGKRPGDLFAMPVFVSLEGGVSYLGTSGDAASLEASIAASSQEAQVKGSELDVQSRISFKALAAASSAGERAFERSLVQLGLNMELSIQKRLEIARLYGQVGIGTVQAQTNIDASTADVVISTNSWSAAIWGGLQNSKVDLFQSNLSTTRANCANMTILAVSPSTRTIRVNVASIGTPTAGDVFFFKGANVAGTFYEQAGLQKILTNQGTLFNVNAALYDVWKGNTNSTQGVLTLDRLQTDIMTCMGRGFVGKSIALVSPYGWAQLLNDQAALRMFDSSYSSADMRNGAKGLHFYSAAGEMEVIAHPFVKQGDYFILSENDLLRVGATDVTNNIPGTDDPAMVLVPATNYVQFTLVSDEQIFTRAPCYQLFGSNTAE